MMNIQVSFLRQCPIFYQFTAEQLGVIADLGKEVVYQTGDIIFAENTASKELYLVIVGEVDILQGPGPDGGPQAETLIATMERGQTFGEIALVDEGLRSASARAAKDDTHLLVIPRDRLIQLCREDTEIGYLLMYNLAAEIAVKIRNTEQRTRDQLLYRPAQA